MLVMLTALSAMLTKLRLNHGLAARGLLVMVIINARAGAEQTAYATRLALTRGAVNKSAERKWRLFATAHALRATSAATLFLALKPSAIT